MISFTDQIIAGDFSLGVPDDVVVRIDIDCGSVRVNMYAHSPMGRRFLDNGDREEKMIFVRKILALILGDEKEYHVAEAPVNFFDPIPLQDDTEAGKNKQRLVTMIEQLCDLIDQVMHSTVERNEMIVRLEKIAFPSIVGEK